jgi:hypothetical protein
LAPSIVLRDFWMTGFWAMRFYIGLFYGQRCRFPAKSQRPTEG